MGTRLKIGCTIFAMLFCLKSYSQKYSVRRDAFDLEKSFNSTKGYMNCFCIKDQYIKVDTSLRSFFENDVSGSYYVQMTPLPLSLMDSVHIFYEKNIYKFYGVPQESGYNTKANMVVYTCTSFCDSKEFRQYVKLLLRRNKSKL